METPAQGRFLPTTHRLPRSDNHASVRFLSHDAIKPPKVPLDTRIAVGSVSATRPCVGCRSRPRRTRTLVPNLGAVACSKTLLQMPQRREVRGRCRPDPMVQLEFHPTRYQNHSAGTRTVSNAADATQRGTSTRRIRSPNRHRLDGSLVDPSSPTQCRRPWSGPAATAQ